MLTFWSLNSLRAVIQVTSSVPEYEQGLLKYFFGDHEHVLDKWKKKLRLAPQNILNYRGKKQKFKKNEHDNKLKKN